MSSGLYFYSLFVYKKSSVKLFSVLFSSTCMANKGNLKAACEGLACNTA